MIFGNRADFFIQTDVLLSNNNYYMGPLNFWIDGKAYPGEGVLITLNSEIMILKDNLDKALNRKFPGKCLDLKQINFEEEELSEENIMYLYLAELGDNGLRLRCDIRDKIFRLFYSMSDEEFQLKEIPINYYEKIINELFAFLLDKLDSECRLD